MVVSLVNHWELADLDTSFATVQSVYLNPKSEVRVGYI